MSDSSDPLPVLELSAWKFSESVRLIRLDQQIRCTLTTRERPLITAANGPLMARHRRSGRTRAPGTQLNLQGRVRHPHCQDGTRPCWLTCNALTSSNVGQLPVIPCLAKPLPGNL
jgi:hypothetical protein